MEHKERRINTFSLNLLNFLTYGMIAIFTSYLQLYYLSSGMDMFQIGILFATGPLVSVVAHPFWNLLRNQQLGTRNTLLFLLAGTALAIHLVLWVGQIKYLVLSSLLLFFFLTPLTNFMSIFNLELVNADPSLVRSKFRSGRLWGAIGLSVVPFFVSFSYGSNISFRLPDLIVITVLIALSAGLAILLPAERKPNQTPPLRAREVFGVLLNKYFITFVVLGMLISVPITVNLMFMPLFITDLGGSLMDVAFALFAASILEAGVFYLLNRFMRRTISALMLGLTLVGLLLTLRWHLMANATAPGEVIGVQVLNTVTLGGFFYLGIQLTALFLPKPFRSAGQTVLVVCWSGLSGIIAGLLGGLLYQSFGAVILYNSLVAMSVCGTIGFGIMGLYIYNNGYKPDQFHS